MNASLILLLHAHLPYVRHPEYEYSLEENWLFEAIRESYVPLLDALEDMVNNGLSPHLTLSLSPTLMEMFNDEMLRSRFVRHIDNLIELSEAEKLRTRKTPFEALAFMYNNKFKAVKQSYLGKYGQDLISAFRRLQDEGHIEIITTSATHAFLPAFESTPDAVKIQIETGIECFARNFGKRPSGLWLPECGYFKGLDSFLKDAGIQFFFLESHGILNGRPTPRYSIYKPVSLPSGLVAFGRDFKSSSQVWCSSRGYPGDPSYRDFYRDIGFDLPSDYIDRYTHLDGIKTFTGMKYYKVTGRTDDKLPYDRAMAMEKVSEHSRHFIESRVADFARLSEFEFPGIIFSAFDAELFGHWWFEGIEWLETLLRNASEDNQAFHIQTPSMYLSSNLSESMEIIEPSPSSWGEGGYNSLWIGEKNHHYYRHLHKMIEDLKSIPRKVLMKKPFQSPLKRAANQALREMLLSQASDWAFSIQRGNASEYAVNRLKKHIENFDMLISMIINNNVDIKRLEELENQNRFFHWLDMH